jgi:hypothetical protein
MKYRLVTLNADGIEERQVIYMRYELEQQTDVEGQPVGRTRGGKITLRVRTPKDGNTDIVEWMCDTNMSKNGKITIPSLSGGDLKIIEFVDGFVVSYSETFDRRKELILHEEFTISAKIIKIGNAVHDNNWSIED